MVEKRRGEQRRSHGVEEEVEVEEEEEEEEEEVLSSPCLNC